MERTMLPVYKTRAYLARTHLSPTRGDAIDMGATGTRHRWVEVLLHSGRCRAIYHISRVSLRPAEYLAP